MHTLTSLKELRLINKNILLVSPDPWDHIFVSKHHYAIGLGKLGNKVFFLSPPASDWQVSDTIFANVFGVNYGGFPPGLRFYPSFLRKRIIRSVYHRLEILCGLKFDIIWSFDNSVFFDFSALPPNVLKISHIVDQNQDFQTDIAASSADFCFCVAESIERMLGKFSDKVYKIPHGFCVPDMTRSIGVSKSNGRLKAIYAGNLAIAYIDWPLLWRTIFSNPTVDFVFIGPGWNVFHDDPEILAAKKGISAQRNVLFLGRIDASELPNHYEQADILLVAYQERFQKDQVSNTHKMMEYLGSGKVVVATHTHEYRQLSPLVVMSESNAAWPGRFKEVLENLQYFNSQELQTRRRHFARENSYERQIEKIEAVISRFEYSKGVEVCSRTRRLIK